jgi:hypothetical protein
MDDQELVERINGLSSEEEQLWSRASQEGGLGGAEQARLEEIRLELEQAYDLLNQRRARRNAGLDPEEAEERPIEILENYSQ